MNAPVPEVEAASFLAPHFEKDVDIMVVPADLARDFARRLAEAQAIERDLRRIIERGRDSNATELSLSAQLEEQRAGNIVLLERAESAERALAEARIEHEAYCLRIAEQHDAQLAEALAKERERWDLYCLRRAAEYCYDVPVECNTPETQDARDRTRAAIHKRILELLGERSALTDEAKP